MQLVHRTFPPFHKAAPTLTVVGIPPAEGFLTTHFSSYDIFPTWPQRQRKVKTHIFGVRCRKSWENCGASYLEEDFSSSDVFSAGSAQYILEVRLVNKSWPRPCPPKQSTAVTILSGNMMWYHRWLTHRGFPASHHLNMTAFHHPDLFMGESWVRGLTLPPRAQVHGWPSVASISDWACENTHAHPHTQIPFLVEGHFHPDSFLPLAWLWNWYV